MLGFLPYVYFAVLVLETLGLGVWWLLVRPEASDPLSVYLGWAGLISMVVMLIYSVARRSRTFRNVARLSYWLHFHIFLGLQGFVFVVFHSLPMFDKGLFGINWFHPGVINLFAVCVVIGSGMFGRYLYAQLPRAIGGEQLAAREVEKELKEMAPVPADVEALWKDMKVRSGFSGLVRADFETRAAVRKLRAMKLDKAMHDLATRRVWLERRKAMLLTTQWIFRWWIILHRPVAAAMYLISLAHVILAYMFTPGLL